MPSLLRGALHFRKPLYRSILFLLSRLFCVPAAAPLDGKSIIPPSTFLYRDSEETLKASYTFWFERMFCILIHMIVRTHTGSYFVGHRIFFLTA